MRNAYQKHKDFLVKHRERGPYVIFYNVYQIYRFENLHHMIYVVICFCRLSAIKIYTDPVFVS